MSARKSAKKLALQAGSMSPGRRQTGQARQSDVRNTPVRRGAGAPKSKSSRDVMTTPGSVAVKGTDVTRGPGPSPHQAQLTARSMRGGMANPQNMGGSPESAQALSLGTLQLHTPTPRTIQTPNRQDDRVLRQAVQRELKSTTSVLRRTSADLKRIQQQKHQLDSKLEKTARDQERSLLKREDVLRTLQQKDRSLDESLLTRAKEEGELLERLAYLKRQLDEPNSVLQPGKFVTPGRRFYPREEEILKLKEENKRLRDQMNRLMHTARQQNPRYGSFASVAMTAPTLRRQNSKMNLPGPGLGLDSTPLTGRRLLDTVRQSRFSYGPPPRIMPNVSLVMRPSRSLSPAGSTLPPPFPQMTEKAPPPPPPKGLEPPTPLTIGKGLAARGILTTPTVPSLSLPPPLRELSATSRDRKPTTPRTGARSLSSSDTVKRVFSVPPSSTSNVFGSATINLSSPLLSERPTMSIRSIAKELHTLPFQGGSNLDSLLMSPRTTSRQTTASLPPPSMRFVSVPISETQSLSKIGTAECEDYRSSAGSSKQTLKLSNHAEIRTPKTNNEHTLVMDPLGCCTNNDFVPSSCLEHRQENYSEPVVLGYGTVAPLRGRTYPGNG